MTIYKSLVAAGAALLLASPALAASTAGDFAAKGPGRVRCDAFVDAKTRNLPEYGQYTAFLEGFITAANRYEPVTYDLAPWHTGAALGLIVEQYCKANAQDNLTVAVLKLTAAFNGIRLTEMSPLIEVTEGSARAVLYEAILKRAQNELKKKGLYALEPDGKFNPETKTALQTFQTQAKLPASGVPDPATLWVLLNP